MNLQAIDDQQISRNPLKRITEFYLFLVYNVYYHEFLFIKEDLTLKNHWKGNNSIIIHKTGRQG